jgi:hypothetical protein
MRLPNYLMYKDVSQVDTTNPMCYISHYETLLERDSAGYGFDHGFVARTAAAEYSSRPYREIEAVLAKNRPGSFPGDWSSGT